MAPEHITQAVLGQVRAALAGTTAFDFSLSGVGRFLLTAYLAPEPADAFIALTRRLARTFPQFPPFGGAFETIVPHLTIADGDAAHADMASQEMSDSIRKDGPIAARCRAVKLLENASGLWKPMHVFALPDGARR